MAVRPHPKETLEINEDAEEGHKQMNHEKHEDQCILDIAVLPSDFHDPYIFRRIRGFIQWERLNPSMYHQMIWKEK
jgi:hypothetical protein